MKAHDHLETKKQIEELRDKFGSNWLNADGENIVKEVYPQTETEDELLMRKRILVDDLNDDSLLSSTPKEGMTSRLEITEENLNSTTENYGTASERTVTEGNSSWATGEGDNETATVNYHSAVSGRVPSVDLTGLEFFHTQQSVEEDVHEPNEVEYLVEKLNSARDETGIQLVVVVSDLSVKEKEPLSKE